MLLCRIAVNFKTAALQHRNTKNNALPLANQDFDMKHDIFQWKEDEQET